MNDLVKSVSGKIVVSSKDVADKFERLHRHVLRDIKNLNCSSEFRESNFELSSYIQSKTKSYHVLR